MQVRTSLLILVTLAACVHHPVEHPRVQVSGGGEPPANIPPPVLPTRFGAECDGVVPPAEPRDTTRDYHGVANQLIVAPPVDVPRSMRGTTFRVQLRYRADGGVDSIRVLDAVDAAYARRYLTAMERAYKGKRFNPAVYRGCAVDSWFTGFVTMAN